VLLQIGFYSAFALSCARFVYLRKDAPAGCPEVTERMERAYELALGVVLALLGGAGLKGEPLPPDHPVFGD
jgi:hypothetical protein